MIKKGLENENYKKMERASRFYEKRSNYIPPAELRQLELLKKETDIEFTVHSTDGKRDITLLHPELGYIPVDIRNFDISASSLISGQDKNFFNDHLKKYNWLAELVASSNGTFLKNLISFEDFAPTLLELLFSSNLSERLSNPACGVLYSGFFKNGRHRLDIEKYYTFYIDISDMDSIKKIFECLKCECTKTGKIALRINNSLLKLKLLNKNVVNKW